MLSELPIGDTGRGIAQGIVRIHADDPDKAGVLLRAYGELSKIYQTRTFHVTIQAHSVLRHDKEGTFSLYYGLRFGRSRSIFLGQEVDDEGAVVRLFREFAVRDVSDLSKVPLTFSTEDLSQLFKKNFRHSQVTVVRVVCLVYVFSLGLEDFGKKKKISSNYLRMLWSSSSSE